MGGFQEKVCGLHRCVCTGSSLSSVSPSRSSSWTSPTLRSSPQTPKTLWCPSATGQHLWAPLLTDSVFMAFPLQNLTIFFYLFVIFTCSTSVCMCYNVSWLVYTQISEQKVGEAWEVSCAWRADGAEFSSGWASVCQIHQGETETVTVCEVSGVWFTSRSCLFPPVASDVHQIH